MLNVLDYRGRLNFYPDTKDLKRASDFKKKSVRQRSAMFKAIQDPSKLFRRANAFMIEGFHVKDEVIKKIGEMNIGPRTAERYFKDLDTLDADILLKKIELLFVTDE